jgi:hypothetical protein
MALCYIGDQYISWQLGNLHQFINNIQPAL